MYRLPTNDTYEQARREKNGGTGGTIVSLSLLQVSTLPTPHLNKVVEISKLDFQ